MKEKLFPESLMMSYGYKPHLSEGAAKPPIFQTSTFVFRSAEEGKAFFELAYGLREPSAGEEMGLIYSRINNPNLEILENRLCLWDQAEECAVFESGMAAIATVLLEFLKPGDALLYSSPMYGGTEHFIEHYLENIGIRLIDFSPRDRKEEIIEKIKDSGWASALKFIYIETPANPTNEIIDISMCREIARQFSTAKQSILIGIDNTYMGPLWSHPLRHGADLVLYSATKYIGGHSDLIAGAVLGNKNLIQRVKTLRTFLGNMASPHTGWLLLRSLETLKVRMTQQMKNARKIAKFLIKHPKISRVYYPGLIPPGTDEYEIYRKQYHAPGAMLAFDLKGNQKSAFQFLNHLRLFKIAVSLGSTESLAQHPNTMTHAGIDRAKKLRMGITDQMIRLSIGIENYRDLINDLEQALDQVLPGPAHVVERRDSLLNFS